MPQGAIFQGAKGGVGLTTSIGAGDALTTVTLIVGKEKQGQADPYNSLRGSRCPRRDRPAREA
jgi:hypothetical protein